MSLPLVTALCLTRNRREWLPKAIRCFEQQTYEAKELLIVADGEPVGDLVPDGPRCQIRLLQLTDRLTVGEKRNLGCRYASGELICHWDDDDWSAAGRIEDQVDRLTSHRLAVTGYHSLLFREGEGCWWKFAGEKTSGAGATLCYEKTWWRAHPFAPVQSGQDEAFAREAHDCGRYLGVDAGEMMYATIHPGNTSQRNTKAGCWSAVARPAWAYEEVVRL